MSMRWPGRFATALSLATGLVVCVAAVAPAQTLGELARQEEARKNASKTPPKVITNDTIHSLPRPTPGGASTTAAPTTTAPSSSAAAGTQKPAGANAEEKKPAADPKKDEAAWRQRMQTERDALQRAQMFAEALQSRINSLTTDFTSRADPAQRAVIATDRQKALDELGRVKNEIAQHTKAITTLQDEARRANVPPGWLRP